MTKFRAPRENCLSTIRFLHINITNEPLAVSVVLPYSHSFSCISFHLPNYLSVSNDLQSATA
jgi:hypothetical protein